METPKEFVGSKDQLCMVSAKGRRNKRMRLISGGADATSSSGDELGASSSLSGEISTEEEEDMANCLILLAQGDHAHRPPTPVHLSKAAAFYLYHCKTCNRTFPSFQALGGHRASHKKPKPIAPAAPPSPVQELEEAEECTKAVPVQVLTKSGTHNFQAHKSGPKIHECSICGLEFSSGQALGGHMRRHRAAGVPSTHAVARNTEHTHNQNDHDNCSRLGGEVMRMKQRSNSVELDLNLPAPEEDLRETKFQFPATPQTIVMFSAPTLVDCHY